MRKKFTLIIIITFIFSIFSFYINPAFADSEKIYLGGMPAGFSLYTRGAHVVGLCDVITDNGIVSPAKNADICVGDIILSVDGDDVNNAKDLEKTINNDVIKTLKIKRNDELFNLTITPAKDLSGHFKLGLFIRDSVNGIGTITYIKGNKFASLGHPILDDKNNLLEITNGDLFDCNITNYVKGERGKAGELHGVFCLKKIGKVYKNSTHGVFGTILTNEIKKDLKEIEVGVASVGKAQILSTIDGDVPLYYDISIIKVNTNSDSKNFVIKIEDDRLLSTTGGIVQGMSGSPIVQNGKLVGAVTHVFINDPSRGFGISINNMLND